MRALLADPSARLRSMVGAILDRSWDLCVRLAHRCFQAREAIDPTPAELTPDASARIWQGVQAQIAPPPVAFCCGQSFTPVETFAAHAHRCTLAVTLRATIVVPTSAQHWGHA